MHTQTIRAIFINLVYAVDPAIILNSVLPHDISTMSLLEEMYRECEDEEKEEFMRAMRELYYYADRSPNVPQSEWVIYAYRHIQETEVCEGLKRVKK